MSIVLFGDGQAMVQVVEAESSVWIANSGGEGGRHLTVQPVPVSSTRVSTTVPNDLAQELGRIWREELLEVAPRDDNQLPVLDGSTYTFLQDATVGPRLCGQAYLGQPRRLIHLAKLLRDYAKGTDHVRGDILDELRRHAI